MAHDPEHYNYEHLLKWVGSGTKWPADWGVESSRAGALTLIKKGEPRPHATAPRQSLSFALVFTVTELATKNEKLNDHEFRLLQKFFTFAPALFHKESALCLSSDDRTLLVTLTPINRLQNKIPVLNLKACSDHNVH